METIAQTRAQERTTKVIQTLKQQYNVNEFDNNYYLYDLKGLQEIRNVLKSITSDLKDQKDMEELEGYDDDDCSDQWE